MSDATADILDKSASPAITTRRLERRRLFKQAALGAVATATMVAGSGSLFAGTAAAASDPYATPPLTDLNIFNFALNLEYLEAEFYLRAAFGTGLESQDVGGVGATGPVWGGSKVPFATPLFQQYAQEIALDEQNHVRAIRATLGKQAVARPTIDLLDSFTTAARAAGVIGPSALFNPFLDENSFLLAAFIFEDVGVTAYHGAAPYIKNKDYLAAASGILAVEAYHAGAIRTLLLGLGLSAPANKISALRAAASEAIGGPMAGDDQGITVNGRANIVPTDSNSIAFARTPQEVLNIVYLGGPAGLYGFFPKQLNGAIR
nr:ferritin-like domain-containing protein [uncultured Lichenicoccus sp.]